MLTISFIASASGGKTVKLWNLEIGNLQNTLGGGESGPADGIDVRVFESVE